MENNKYLNKVIEHLVKGTKLDYEKEIVSNPLSDFVYPFFSYSLPFPHFLKHPSSYYYSLTTYCRDYFGLTKEEIGYVWEEYKKIITEKIYNG